MLPVSEKKAFFISFEGQYNDNPKAISLALRERHPDIKQYWCITEKSKRNDIPDYIVQLNPQKISYLWHKNRCKFIIDNSVGYYFFYDKNPNTIKKLLFNKKQYNISTWHGFPIKAIGCKMIGNENWTYDTIHSSTNVLIAGSQKIKHIFEESFFNKFPVNLTGTPRNDILFNCDDKKVVQLKNKLHIELTKKVVLYAPTYRNNLQDSGVIQMTTMDLDTLFRSLNKKFGGEWVFVFRAHNLVLDAVEGFKSKKNNYLVSGNKFDDMADYLAVADVLISDYSGCIIDCLLTSKPCFLYAHDYDDYTLKERGLETPLDILPYSFSQTFNELIENIKNYDQGLINKKRMILLEQLGSVEDGRASENVVNLIEAQMSSKNKKYD